MEQYKRHKDDQIHKLKFSLDKAQGDIKLLVEEHEKQKHKAAEKVRMLSEMFKENSWNVRAWLFQSIIIILSQLLKELKFQ